MTLSEINHSPSTGDNDDTTQRIPDHVKLELNTFQYTDHNLLDIENDIDPDNNFFSNINDNCCYYTDEQYNQNIKGIQKRKINLSPLWVIKLV